MYFTHTRTLRLAHMVMFEEQHLSNQSELPGHASAVLRVRKEYVRAFSYTKFCVIFPLQVSAEWRAKRVHTRRGALDLSACDTHTHTHTHTHTRGGQTHPHRPQLVVSFSNLFQKVWSSGGALVVENHTIGRFRTGSQSRSPIYGLRYTLAPRQPAHCQWRTGLAS